MGKSIELNEMSRDVLRELGNIGIGNAVTALSKMMKCDFEIDLPRVKIINYQDTPEILGGAEQFKTGILLELGGEVSGMFVFLLDGEFGQAILNTMLGEEKRDMAHMDELSSSVICEVGNIVCCSYINALASMMGVKIQVSVPDICSDMVGAILSVPMIHFANLSDELMIIENEFTVEGQSFESYVLFLPELKSLNKMFELLGI